MEFTGLDINIDDNFLLSNKHNVNNMINKLKFFSSRCTQMSYGGFNNNEEYDPIPSTKNKNVLRQLILSVQTDVISIINIEDLNQIIHLLNSDELLNRTLGHCYITWDRVTNICGIWDICVHEDNYPNMQKKGSILMENIMEKLAVNLPEDTILWLGVDIQNKMFANAIGLYAKFGFKDPFIEKSDPFGNRWNNLQLGFVSLSRTNEYILQEEINKNETIKNVMYVLTQYVKINKIKLDYNSVKNFHQQVNYDIQHNLQNCCTLKCKFDTKYLKLLRVLTLMTKTLNLYTQVRVNKYGQQLFTVAEGTATQKEKSGAFKLKANSLSQDGIVIFDIIPDRKRGFLNGTEIETQFANARYNFHTHPRETYGIFNVGIGFPSGQDYAGILSNIGYLIFHCVITIEGIYIISLHHYWATNFENLKLLLTKYKDYISETIGKPTIEGGMEVAKNFVEGYTAEQMGKMYAQNINTRTIFPPNEKNKTPIFSCTFLSWTELENNTVIDIAYPKINDQCFAKEKSLKMYNKLILNL